MGSLPSSLNDNTSQDLSSKAISTSVMLFKPMAKSQLQAEAWRPSYQRLRLPSVENDFI